MRLSIRLHICSFMPEPPVNLQQGRGKRTAAPCAFYDHGAGPQRPVGAFLSFCQKRRSGSLFCTGCREENRPYGNDAVAVSHRCSVLAFGRFKLAFGSSRIFVLLLILFVWFYRWSKKQFGGITGDLAGFYLQAGELVCLIAALVLAGWVSNNVGG